MKRFMGTPYIIGFSTRSKLPCPLVELAKLAQQTKEADKQSGVDWNKGNQPKRSGKKLRQALREIK